MEGRMYEIYQLEKQKTVTNVSFGFWEYPILVYSWGKRKLRDHSKTISRFSDDNDTINIFVLTLLPNSKIKCFFFIFIYIFIYCRKLKQDEVAKKDAKQV